MNRLEVEWTQKEEYAMHLKNIIVLITSCPWEVYHSGYYIKEKRKFTCLCPTEYASHVMILTPVCGVRKPTKYNWRWKNLLDCGSHAE